MANQMEVEICIDCSETSTVLHAVSAAYEGGAATVELCSAMHLDGLTPLREALRPKLLDENGVWQVDYVRLRFAATKPWSEAAEREYDAMLTDIAWAIAV